MKYVFYLGSYARKEENSIYQYELDAEKKEVKMRSAVKGIDNPSYLLMHPNKKVMYSVEELTPEGRLAVFSLEDMPEYLFSLPSKGADPCHLSMDDTGEFLFVANYTSGSLTVFRLDAEGKPVECTDHKQHVGCGKHPERQEGPHVHFSGMVNGFLYVCDLGLDRVICYKLNHKTGKLENTEKNLCFPEGTGPRHFAVCDKYPELLYVVGELTGEVIVFKKQGDSYEIVQRISSLPEEFEGENTAAAIKFSENQKLLFVSNRGSDSITSFVVQENGMLKKMDIISCGGKGPRDFSVFGELLVVANQYTDNLALIEYAEDTGKMQLLSHKEAVPKPVMISAVRNTNEDKN